MLASAGSWRSRTEEQRGALETAIGKPPGCPSRRPNFTEMPEDLSSTERASHAAPVIYRYGSHSPNGQIGAMLVSARERFQRSPRFVECIGQQFAARSGLGAGKLLG